MKMCKDFAPNFGDKRTGCCITTMHHLTLTFHQEMFYQKRMTVVPHPPHSSLFPRLKIKLKASHFDTTEVIEAASQAVVNTRMKNDFQNAFKNYRSAGNGADARKGTASRAIVTSRLNDSF
jgi:hypothetical protein